MPWLWAAVKENHQQHRRISVLGGKKSRRSKRNESAGYKYLTLLNPLWCWAFLVKYYNLSNGIMCPTYSFMNCCSMEQVDEFVTYLSCNDPIILQFQTIHCHEGQYIHVTMNWCASEWQVTQILWVSSSISLNSSTSTQEVQLWQHPVLAREARFWRIQIYVISSQSGSLWDLTECKIAEELWFTAYLLVKRHSICKQTCLENWLDSHTLPIDWPT